MKKFLCLIIAIASMCLLLVSCEDDILEEIRKAERDNPYVIPESEALAVVDFYIIGGDESALAANLTVKNKIKDMFKANYNTEVEMHYISADEYANTVKADLETYKSEKNNPDAKKRSFVVLVNSEELYDDLKGMGVLVNAATFIESSSYKYGTLKKQIPTISVVKETDIPTVDKDGNPATEEGYYLIPNRQVYQSFDYILINKSMAINYSMVTAAEACKTAADVDALLAEFKDFCKKNTNLTDEQIETEAEKFITTGLKGYNGDMVAASDENYVVLSAVSDITKADVCSSGFVIAGDKELSERAMRVIYALNTDSYYRNLLQYGVEDINYTVHEENGIKFVTRAAGNASYKMPLIYTGDIYMAYNCKDVCIFCTEEQCENHIYWTPWNNATCTTWVEYNLNGGVWEEGFTPLIGMTNTTLLLDDYIPEKASDIITINGRNYNVTYTFAGWYSGVALTEDTRVKEVNFGNGGVVRIYAKWDETRTPA